MTDYETTVEFHHRVEALYPEVERHRSWFCDMQLVGPNVPVPTGVRSRVDCARVFCALAIKAATTKRSIFTLCESGDGDSAATLERVLLENAVLMHWLLGGPGRDRLETYVLFMSVLHEHTVQVVEKHFGHHPDFVSVVKGKSDPYHRAIARAVFGNHRNTWAYFPVPGKPGKLRQVKIAQMFQEVFDDDFSYTGPYASGSQFIHSGPESLYQILPELVGARYVKLAPMPSPRQRGTALSFSNVSMLRALKALDEYVGLGLAERIDEIANEWKAYAKGTFEQTQRKATENGSST